MLSIISPPHLSSSLLPKCHFYNTYNQGLLHSPPFCTGGKPSPSTQHIHTSPLPHQSPCSRAGLPSHSIQKTALMQHSGAPGVPRSCHTPFPFQAFAHVVSKAGDSLPALMGRGNPLFPVTCPDASQARGGQPIPPEHLVRALAFPLPTPPSGLQLCLSQYMLTT